MECGKDGEEDGDGRTVAGEMTAAKALAGMAQCSAARGGASDSAELHAVEDQSAAAQLLTITSPEKLEKSDEHISTHLCTTSSRPNPVMKFRPKLTEAEKEERKLRRVMANRESARQTIRRRQAMHLELSKKADDVMEENEHLKKQKELMVEECNSLENRNEFLTAQLAKVKRAAAGEREKEEEQNSCPPIFLHNPPSLVPCFWPSVFPYAYSNPNIPCSSHLSRPGPPVFLFPIPWLLPPLTHTGSVGRNTCFSEAGPNMRVEGCDEKKCVSAEADDLFVAAEARRRRNELMNLKNCKYHKL